MTADDVRFSSEDFVKLVYESVYLGAIRDAMKVFETPPGRAPSPRYVDLNRWFMQLNDRDRRMLPEALAYAADSAIFHLFCLIDNVAPATDGFRDELRLTVLTDGVERPLSPDEDELHSLFRSFVDKGVEERATDR